MSHGDGLCDDKWILVRHAVGCCRTIHFMVPSEFQGGFIVIVDRVDDGVITYYTPPEHVSILHVQRLYACDCRTHRFSSSLSGVVLVIW